MSVVQQYAPELFDGNGSTSVPYPIGLERDSDDDFSLLIDGVETTNFTIAEDGLRTGTAYYPGVSLTLYRRTPLLQTNPYLDNTTPAPEDVRQSFDKITLAAQELREENDRSVRAKIGDVPPTGSFKKAPLTTQGQDSLGNIVARTATEEMTHLGIDARFDQALTDATNATALAASAETAATASEARATGAVAEIAALLPSLVYNFAGTPSTVNFIVPNTSQPTLELIGPELSGGTRIRSRTMVLGRDSKFYSPPYYAVDGNADSAMSVLDPATETWSYVVTEPYSDTTEANFLGGNTTTRGVMYFNPRSAPTGSGFLKVDSRLNDGDPGYLDVVVTAARNLRSSAIANNDAIYAFRRSDAAPLNSLVKLDTRNDAITTVYFPLMHSGAIYDLNGDWEAQNAAGSGKYDAIWGATEGENGKIYGTPWGMERLLIVDPTTDTVTQGVDEIYGLRTPTTNPPIEFFSKYCGGVMVPGKNAIYCFPRFANAILKIDTLTDSVTEIPLPVELQSDTNGLSKCFQGALAPDGKIYSVPWQQKYIFWIDPDTDVIEWMDLTTLCDASLGGDTGTGYWTAAHSYGDSLYFCPGGSHFYMKLTP